jgi:lipopolysaccharide transport system ATP-binding protein
MSSDFVIKVENLSKCYQIYDKPRDRLMQGIMPPLQRLIGKQPKQYYREFWALQGVSFEVKKGETVGIIGRNGSGKSTLLQMICGTLTPTSGNITTNGRVAALLELGAGFNPEFTGRENVYMNASILGLTKEEVDERFDDIAEFAEIGDFIEQPVKTYSSGMFVRLAFAVIAYVDADILVIDEALAVGDAFFTQKCMRFLRKFMENGTLLFVSHDTSAVINLCQRAVWLNKGYSEFQGTPKEAADRYLAALYESQQGESTTKTLVTQENQEQPSEHPLEQPRDMRLDFINTTQYRNDIELFSFTPDAANFGKGGAIITSIQVLDQNNKNLAWVVGGEHVQLVIHCMAHTDLTSPLVGFLLNDKLGQPLFGDNTFITYFKNPLQVKSGHIFVTRFDFIMPILPAGDYSLTVAIAEGTQNEHIQHHWIHDALILKSHSSSVSTGLVGIPMMNIRMELL